MGGPLWLPGTAHALPRRTQSAVGLVVDGRPSDAGGDPGADAERRRAVAGGEPAGCGADRARSVPFLQPSRDVPAAVDLRPDRRLLHVAAADPPHRADRVCALDHPDRRYSSAWTRSEGLAAL